MSSGRRRKGRVASASAQSVVQAFHAGFRSPKPRAERAALRAAVWPRDRARGAAGRPRRCQKVHCQSIRVRLAWATHRQASRPRAKPPRTRSRRADGARLRRHSGAGARERREERRLQRPAWRPPRRAWNALRCRRRWRRSTAERQAQPLRVERRQRSGSKGKPGLKPALRCSGGCFLCALRRTSG